MSDEEDKEKEEAPMNGKVLLFFIVGLLAVAFVSVLFIAVPWMLHRSGVAWNDYAVDLVILLAIGMFIFGFYNNTKMH